MNDKVVRQYYIQQIKTQEELTSGAVDTLLDIALSCPFVAGQAVYFARAVLKANDYNFVYDYPDSPESCIEPRESKIVQKAEKLIKIYPNPSSTGVHIESDEEIVRVFIVNSQGDISYHKQTADIRFIKYDNLPDGLYVLKLITKSGKVELHKLIKQEN
ncbi:MAG TPA: T9SS type A sorting domain-containing protein [Saprospiraceae bacterium]|nr:T9SS type A sorting domain-containing protein [Saprospiraceae bacterium]MCC6687883.1 T9SS type A sorting domain-containing protein [Saprospiraceae bacterium]HMV22757.1 T9SS type A sorting domain-containing protein [Saprospiraceae bacterium]HMW75283.1 T9SS type A sorting domain-containing protein [Saprospiraceae bacterium]HNA42119.1 T9SS type A sorting domain-containing protein [Saprospiraceae bacterium]